MSDGKSIQIKIFKLARNDSPMAGDITAMVVAAADEKQARQIANQESKAEGYIWTNGSHVTVEEIGLAHEGISGVVSAAEKA